MAKKTKKASAVQRPLRDPDHISKRGVYYWWAPEWTRGTDWTNTNFGRIQAIREPECKSAGGHKTKCKCPETAHLYMKSKDGNLSFIKGSIQKEFRDWHDDRQIDYILLGMTVEEASEHIINETED